MIIIKKILVLRVALPNGFGVRAGFGVIGIRVFLLYWEGFVF
jgi:hypothetical protein